MAEKSPESNIFDNSINIRFDSNVSKDLDWSFSPEIKVLSSETEMEYEEGCLSVPGFFEVINRPDSIEVSALNRNGEEINIKADGFLAVVIQHENDHLLGKVFVDYLSGLKRQRIKKQLIKQKRVATK